MIERQNNKKNVHMIKWGINQDGKTIRAMKRNGENGKNIILLFKTYTSAGYGFLKRI